MIPGPLKRLFNRKPSEGGEVRTAEALGGLLDIPPEKVDLDALCPAIIPREFSASGDWPGPVVQLPVDGVDLTWVVHGEPDLVRYVDWRLDAYWRDNEVDWRSKAMANLVRVAHAHPHSHEFRGDDGRVVMVVMMHEDGLGPSRLLVPHLLDEVFPDGYQVALPELTCAFAFGVTAGDEDPRIEELISGCFTNGTRPLSPLRYQPEHFWLAVDQTPPVAGLEQP
ncbi:hypothetical protein [Phenylobacterium montanum]|uniref:Uncharacterized protein n=1 Tax=Phenylobacterium montanum TaxID=2823693 RepID=A0A975IWY7_9CAUL|nr:hypothetical protein [Caulobacter sp. S6]QUD90572.1 hypothetical protein KCG34_12225 [Caulobacter sp. S6]